MQPTTRREFLSATGAAAFLAGTTPVILGAEDKAGTKIPIVGEGDFRFECHHNWGELPKSISWRNTHGVTIDKDGLIYIKHQAAPKSCDTVAVFDADGKFVRSFGLEYAGGGHGIDIRTEDGQEFLYLSDTLNGQVVKCDLNGEWVWKKRYPREAGVYPSLDKFRPTNVCFGPNGDFYVGDGYGSSFLHQYDIHGSWIRNWGGTGTAPGQMRTPHGQWLDARPGREPSLVIADRANARLQYFSLDGQPQSIMQGVKDASQEGPQAPLKAADGREIPLSNVAGISFPADVDIQGEYMLVPDLHARVLIFNGQNELVANLGYDAEWTAHVLDGMQVRRDPAKFQPGKFVHPHDACFDKDGNIFVTEWVDAGRVTFLKRV